MRQAHVITPQSGSAPGLLHARAGSIRGSCRRLPWPGDAAHPCLEDPGQSGASPRPEGRSPTPSSRAGQVHIFLALPDCGYRGAGSPAGGSSAFLLLTGEDAEPDARPKSRRVHRERNASSPQPPRGANQIVIPLTRQRDVEIRHRDERTRAAVAGWVQPAPELFPPGFGRVFTTQSQLVALQDQLAVAGGNIALSPIAIYGALGGGWQGSVAVYAPHDSPVSVADDGVARPVPGPPGAHRIDRGAGHLGPRRPTPDGRAVGTAPCRSSG